MTTETWPSSAVARPRTRLRALQFPAVSGNLVAQLGGGAMTLVGVYLLLGLAITLIVAGVSTTVIAALREAGKV